MNLNKHIKTFEGFKGKYNTSPENALIVVDITVQEKLEEILKDLNPLSKELVNEFIENAEFRDLADENGKEKITLPRLLKKFDAKVTDDVLSDINNHFKKLNGGDAYVDIKK